MNWVSLQKNKCKVKQKHIKSLIGLVGLPNSKYNFISFGKNSINYPKLLTIAKKVIYTSKYVYMYIHTYYRSRILKKYFIKVQTKTKPKS